MKITSNTTRKKFFKNFTLFFYFDCFPNVIIKIFLMVDNFFTQTKKKYRAVAWNYLAPKDEKLQSWNVVILSFCYSNYNSSFTDRKVLDCRSVEATWWLVLPRPCERKSVCCVGESRVNWEKKAEPSRASGDSGLFFLFLVVTVRTHHLHHSDLSHN